MKSTSEMTRRRMKLTVKNALKAIDKISEEIETYGDFTDLNAIPLIRILYEDKEGTHVALQDEEYDVGIENRIDGQSLTQAYHLLIKVPEFKELESVFMTRFGNSHFEKILTFLEIALEGNISHEELISQLAEEVLEIPVEWKFSLYVQGLMIEQDEIDAGTLKLRKLASQDFETGVFTVSDSDSEPIPVHTVVEWTTQGIPKGPKAKLKRIEDVAKVLTRLRLVKDGLFRVTAWRGKTLALLEEGEERVVLESHPLLLGVSPVKTMPKPVVFNSDDQEKYARYQKSVFKLIEGGKSNGIDFALKMLNESTWKPIEEALLFCTIGLESLFLVNEQELRQKLATRVAVLLQNVGENIESTYDDVWTAYGLRNRFVHGSLLKREFDEHEDALLYKIAVYLRKSIVLMAQLATTKRKHSELIATLDRALISSEAERKLRMLAKSIII